MNVSKFSDNFKENIYGHKKRLNFILEEISEYSKIKGTPKILDLGCGTGQMITLPIAERGFFIMGIDLDQESINDANECNPFPNAQFYCENIVSFSNHGLFDIIICSEVLEHLDDPKSILFSIKSLLKPEGRLIVTIPNGYGPFELEQSLLKFLLTYFPFFERKKQEILNRNIQEGLISMTKNDESIHVQFFTLKYFYSMISSCGYIIEKRVNSSFIAGPFSNQIIKNCPNLLKIDVEFLPKFLPSFLCSGWYFNIKKR